MSRVAEILLEQGRAAARARELSGQIWGNAVSNLGQIPGQVMEQRRLQQRQDLQDQLTKQDLALGQDKLLVAQRQREGQALYGQLVKDNAKLNPDTGHVDYNTDVIANGLLSAGHPELATKATDLLKTIDDNFTDTQNKHLAFKARQEETYANVLGAVANADPKERADRYALMLASLPDEAKKNDPVFSKLPPIYPGDTAIAQFYQAHQTDAQRLTQAKEKAAEHKANIREVPKEGTLVDIGDIDQTTGKPRVLATGEPKTPTPKSYQHVDKLLDGKPTTLLLDPAPGGKVYDLSGAAIENAATRVKPIPSQASVTISQTGTDAKAIADAIQRGEQPPDVQGLYRMAGPVRAELAKQSYDLTTANLDWQATKKHVATLNGAQQTRLRQAISTASDSLDVIDDLAKKWDGGRFPILNKANLALAKNGVYGKDVASVATQLEAQITDVTSELGNVYMGGNSPTDHALQLAGKNLSANWDKKVLLDLTQLARKNLQIRQNSMMHSGAAGLSTQPNAAPVSAPTKLQWNADHTALVPVQ